MCNMPKIYLPCNFEVNSITYFGVITLFSSNFQHFNTLQNGLRDLLQNCMVWRSWHAEHVCSSNLTFISNSFWNKGRKVFYKNVQHVKIYLPCNFEVNSITYFGVITLFSSFFQHFNTFRPLFKKLLEINVKLT
jgi:hypothetical protein